MARGDHLVFDLDADDVRLFSEEAEEQLAILDSALVRLERDADAALLQQIFRAAHTLKGSSATIGHVRMARLTHAMETVFDDVRQGALSPTALMVDTLLVSLDLLRELAGEVQTGIDSGVETEAMEAALLSFVSAEPEPADPSAPSSPATAVADDEANAGHHQVTVSAVIADDCQLPSIRCYQVLQELDAHGSVTSISPSRETIESGGGDNRVIATVLTSASEEELQAAILCVSDVASVTVLSAVESEAATPPSVRATPGHEQPLSDSAAPAPIELLLEGRSAVPANASPAAGSANRPPQSVRIDVERLDGLMNLVGELVIDRSRLQRIREQLAPVLKDASLTELTENFEETTAHLGRITDELQEQIMRSRMLPIRSVMTRLPRLVRDVANKCGKRVELVTSGEETELDRSVIEEISDPLVHILRNAVDHGIESPAERLAAGKPQVGTVSITAWNQETFIYLSIRDDGRGIDTEALRRKAIERGLVTAEAAATASNEAVQQYIFFAGLSTASSISDVSGRGVGMDIVRANVERLHGQVFVRSVLGAGSEFVIQLPLTLATTKALMVGVNDTTYALPLVSVTEALSVNDAEIHNIGGQRTMRLRNQLLPVVDLGKALGDCGQSHRSQSSQFVVAARHGDRQVGFMVDDLLGEQDVVVKSLGTLLGTRRGLTGATILGDGTLGLIVDTASLIADQQRLTTTGRVR